MATALGSAFVAAALALGTGIVAHSWPSDRFRAKPVEFFQNVLGVEPWSKQIEIIEAVRDHKRVAVKAGHKVSKSHTAAGIALWFYESFEDARVVMTSTTSRQVDQILWRELKMMHARAGRCSACKAEDRRKVERHEMPGPRPCPHSFLLDGEPRELARTGLKSPDFREVVGFTAREAEAVAGVSGKNLLYILDEATGIDDAIFEAIEGNRAGGARVLMFSNPTKSEGEFYNAFDSKKAFYKTISISSEDSPNVISGTDTIPGLATREWVQEKIEEWGKDSPLYKVRVLGEFVLHEDGKILSIHAIGESEKRWLDASSEGRLCIGIDPAGSGVGGDESCFASRRNLKILSLIAKRGLTEDGHLAHLLAILRDQRRPGDELPLVVVDCEGAVGDIVWRRLREYADTHPNEFEVLPVRASSGATRQPQNYDRTRDELWANLAQWILQGGAVIPDTKLAKELHAPEWVEKLASAKQKVTPKPELRKKLGRSPDRADAVALAVWPRIEDPANPSPPPPPPPPPSPDPEFASLDPYAGAGTWGGGRT